MIAIVILSAYLYRRQDWRFLDNPMPPKDPSFWTGHSIDCVALTRRIQNARSDYLKVVHKNPKCLEVKKNRLERTRHIVRQLEYFQHEDFDEDSKDGTYIN